ncbi:MAG: intermembrane phospholipid transport protein YdbH family protein, partial [Kangiellaceae bacterium]
QEKQYVVENGHFSSNRPGILKYDSGQNQEDVEANIALHALQDFHYDKLEGTINYNKEGAYEIKLHLLGSNPSLYDGYPIDFDLNLNGELSDVFQSVFLTGDFEKSIIEKAKLNKLNQ